MCHVNILVQIKDPDPWIPEVTLGPQHSRTQTDFK